MTSTRVTAVSRSIAIPAGPIELAGDLVVPADAHGIVVFAHGSGSSRLSPRNQQVARYLQHTGLATLLFDLLTAREGVEDARTAHLRFDIALLADRLTAATEWMLGAPETRDLAIGYFGASTGAAAALIAASRLTEAVRAVVSRGGRPDLAGAQALARVRAPTLLIVGARDPEVIGMNEFALLELGADIKRLEIVPGATHLFEEPGTLDRVCTLARAWFDRYLDAAALPS